MLAAGQRLRSRDDFRVVMRTGAKAGSRTVVVYLAKTGDASSMAGFAVSRAVGGAVVRNRIKRRLRAIMAELLPGYPVGTRVVIRALPDARGATFAALRSDVASGLQRAQAKAA